MASQSHNTRPRVTQRGAIASRYNIRSVISYLQSPWLLCALTSCLILIALNIISPIAANWFAVLLFLLGVPHGAVERTKTIMKFRMPTIAYTVLYVVFGLFVFSSWVISPLATFLIFLFLSAVHFGLSEPEIKLIGIWVILGSCLTFPNETLSIFSSLMGINVMVSELIVATQLLAIFAALGGCFECIYRYLRVGRIDLFRPVLLLIIFTYLPPIHAVAIYFFAFHGMGEFVRTINAVGMGKSKVKWRDVFKLYGPATFPAMFGAVVIIYWVVNDMLSLTVATGLGVAFIIPHMLPVEALLRVDRGES